MSRNPFAKLWVFDASSHSVRDNAVVQSDTFIVRPDKNFLIFSEYFGDAKTWTQAQEGFVSFLSQGVGDKDATLPFVLRADLSLAGNILLNGMTYAHDLLIKLNKEHKGASRQGLRTGASLIALSVDAGGYALARVGACGALCMRGSHVSWLLQPHSYAQLRDPFVNDLSSDEESDIFVSQAYPVTALGLTASFEPEVRDYRLQPGDAIFFISSQVSVPRLMRAMEEGMKHASLSKEILFTEALKVYGKNDTGRHHVAMLEIGG